MMMDKGEDDYGESEDEFGSAIREAFPDEDWDDDRLAAMKEAIRICVEKDEGPPSGKPGSLALIFGAKPKKKE